MRATLANWYNSIEGFHHASYDAARLWAFHDHLFRAPLAILTAVVGGLIFFSFDGAWHFYFGALNLAIAGAVAYQGYRSYPEKIALCNQAGARLGDLLKRIDEVRSLPCGTHGNPADVMADIREEWTSVASLQIPIPERIWKKHKPQIAREPQASGDKPVKDPVAQPIDSAALAAAATAAAVAVFIVPGPFVPLNGILGLTLILLLFAYEFERPRTGLQHSAFGAVCGMCCLLVFGSVYELH